MAKALLITRNDIVKKTALGGAVDADKFLQFVEVAQDTDVQNYLGTDLLEVIQGYIVAGTIGDAGQAAYLSLLTDYIKPMLIHYGMVHYLPWAAYTIGNKGVYKHNSENAETVEKNELDFLIEKERDIAEAYAEKFVKYMIYNQATFAEYTSNSGADVHPDSDVNLTSWYI